MAQVYTRLMFSQTNLSHSIHAGPTVPAGSLWVVRNVQWYNTTGQAFTGLFGAFLTDENGVEFAGTPHPAVGLTPYSWEGRVVIEATGHFSVAPQDAGWDCTVTGFEFILP